MKVSLGNNKGFSLIELMVVVAIIGILASIAVPNYQRFSAKSRQSEAKSNLSAIYSAERAFASEWQGFNGSFLVIGFRPTGFLNYRLTNVAFDTTLAMGAAYNGPVYNAANIVTTDAGVCAGVAAGSCAEMAATAVAGPAAPAVAAPAMTVNTFITTASGRIGVAAVDTWSINHGKVVANPSPGLP